jgi:hypothetical protein
MAASAPSDDATVVCLLVLAFLQIAVVAAIWLGASPKGKAVRGSFETRVTVPPTPPDIRARIQAARRRVIRLPSTTPGQSPFEYNVGDNQGTRASALVRAA